MLSPSNIQIVGQELAIAWSDGRESFIGFEKLRSASPSAENQGERDILGVRHGGHDGSVSFAGIALLGWEPVGNYALRLIFSDGHGSGLYSYELLRQLGDLPSA